MKPYRARFTVLDTGIVSREWIDAVRTGQPAHISAPPAWTAWIAGGARRALRAPPVREHRTPEEQMPTAGRDAALVQCIYQYFQNNPHGFEHCAAALAAMT
jgi:hypothetical protein